MRPTEDRAHHRTMLVMGEAACAVLEEPEEVVSRIRRALRRSDGWFSATVAPEEKPVWINARRICWVGRERTPLEKLRP